jgi:hypothetical protein
VALVAACTPAPDLTEPPPRATTTPEPITSASSAEPGPATIPGLVYVKGTELRYFDPSSGRDELVNELPGPDVALSVDATRYAVVRDLDPGSDPEGFGAPEIAIGALGAAPATLGPGRSPLFSPAGDHLAAITDDGVVTYDLGTGDQRVVLGGDGWSLIGWSGTDIAAGGPDGVALAGGAEPRFLRQHPAAVWGVSPAGGGVLVVGRAGATLTDPVGSTRTAVEPAGRWADGAWSPDGTTIAAVVLGDGPVDLDLVDTASGRARAVPDSRGAQGGVVWSADSQWFAYVRVDPRAPFKLQAVICSVELDCEPAFSWGRGVVLLGLSER